jgi:uncharacterized membrane protein YidH (DUF202 family)
VNPRRFARLAPLGLRQAPCFSKGTAEMSSTKTNPSRLIGLFIIVAGVLMFVAGGVTWSLVTTQLKAENITVAAVTPENPGRLAGDQVAGPFTAYAQADAISHHSLVASKGRTYAQLGDDQRALKTKLAAAGSSVANIAADKDVVALDDIRAASMNASFLRASLLTSVVSFGVAALVMGLGLLFALLGFALVKLPRTTVSTSAPARKAELVGAGA